MKISCQKALLFAIALIIVLPGFLLYGNTRNNGDYERVLCGYIYVPNGSQYEDFYHLGSGECETIVLFSARSMFERILILLNKYILSNIYYTNQAFFFLSIIYFTGAFKLYKRITEHRGIHVLIAPLAILINYIIFAFFFKSFYEESIILTMTPWLTYGYLLLQQKSSQIAFVCSASLILMSKTQMFFILPFLLFYLIKYNINELKKFHKRLLISISFMLIAALVPFLNGFNFELLQPEKHDIFYLKSLMINKYDRFYNGLGWSIPDAQKWPGRTWEERMKYFQSNKKSIQKKTEIYEPFDDVKLFGTSFWDTGIKFSNGPDNIFLYVINPGSFSSYFRSLFNNPNIIWSMIKTTYLITINSDYSLKYIVAPNYWPKLFSTANLLREYIIFLWMIAVLFLLLYRPTIDSVIFAAYLLFSPLIVVISAGFADYEKHLVTYLLLLPMATVFYVTDTKMKPAMPQKSGDTIPTSHASN